MGPRLPIRSGFFPICLKGRLISSRGLKELHPKADNINGVNHEFTATKACGNLLSTPNFNCSGWSIGRISFQRSAWDPLPRIKRVKTVGYKSCLDFDTEEIDGGQSESLPMVPISNQSKHRWDYLYAQSGYLGKVANNYPIPQVKPLLSTRHKQIRSQDNKPQYRKRKRLNPSPTIAWRTCSPPTLAWLR